MDARQRLTAWLEGHGKSQADLARGCGINEATISRIVNGKQQPNLTTIEAVLSWCKTVDPEVTYEDIFREAA